MGLDNPASAEHSSTANATNSSGLSEVGALLMGNIQPRSNHLADPGRQRHPSLPYQAVLHRGASEVAHQRAGKFSLGMGQRLGTRQRKETLPSCSVSPSTVSTKSAGPRLPQATWRPRSRTVFVSSRSDGEMSLTAEPFVVIAHAVLVAGCVLVKRPEAGLSANNDAARFSPPGRARQCPGSADGSILSPTGVRWRSVAHRGAYTLTRPDFAAGDLETCSWNSPATQSTSDARRIHSPLAQLETYLPCRRRI